MQFLSLKALNIGPGDEVITVPFTFYATIGAIVTTGAKPVFVDIGDDYNLNPTNLEKAITKNTKAIIPVHWSGLVCDMVSIMKISKKYSIPIVEDACHAVFSERDGKRAGSFGATGCFSLHPLKNLNVWGDAGVIVTDNLELRNKLFLLRNHGLVNRDTCKIFAYNSRLDSIQAIVALNIIKNKLKNITLKRIENALLFDKIKICIPNYYSSQTKSI